MRKKKTAVPNPLGIDPDLNSAVDARIKEAIARIEAESVPEPETALVQSVSQEMLCNAYTRFGITKEEVDTYPSITQSFEALGGDEGVISYLRASEDPKARTIVGFFDLYRGENIRKAIPFEAYCVAAKITKKKFLQLLMGEVCEQSDTTSTLLASAAHPRVVQKTIDIALSNTPDSGEARSVLHKHRGFLPTPKTQQVTIHGNVNQDNRQDNSRNTNVSIGDLDIGTGKINRATDRFNAARIARSESTPSEDAEEAEFVE